MQMNVRRSVTGWGTLSIAGVRDYNARELRGGEYMQFAA